MIDLRKACEEEYSLCLGFIDEAREHQREMGFVQWDDSYPTPELIMEDIRAKRGYLILDEGSPIGYICIDLQGDSDYEKIDGEWRVSGKFIALHRIAIGKSGRGKGITRAVFAYAKEMCIKKGFAALRMDTDEKNEKMQHILLREGFLHTGTVYPCASPKLAFEWVADN